MDWIFVGFVALLAIGFAVAVGIAIDRDRELEAARAAIARTSLGLRPLPGASGIDIDEATDVPTMVRRLRDRLDVSEFELDQQVRNASYLADLMGVGIVRLDDRGTVELANAAAHILLRRAAGTLRGRTAIETFLDGRVEELIATARATGGASGEFRLSGSEGSILVVRARRSPISGVWVVLEDVSELRRLQQIRTEFVDNLSHELRTPLSTVSLLAETLAREADAAAKAVPPRMRERIAKIEVETGHLVQMVNELLDLARIEGGGPLILLHDVDLGRIAKIEVETGHLVQMVNELLDLARIEGGGPLILLDDVDLGRVATDAADRLRLFADRQGLRLAVDVEPRLPAVRGDEARLGQVVVNLVHNALKFGRAEDRAGGDPSADGPAPVSGVPASSDPAEVRIAVRATGDEVVLSVQDHGVGIPAADQARIFERFYKVDRVRVRGGGTGLGLAIARHVIEQHGGRIGVESEDGRGSTFSVRLPVAASASPGPAGPA